MFSPDLEQAVSNDSFDFKSRIKTSNFSSFVMLLIDIISPFKIAYGAKFLYTYIK